MTKQSKELCKGVAPEIRPQAETLAEAVYSLQKKIIQQIPIYEELPLSQEVTVGTGETILRQNPAVQEFRALVKDYAHVLRSLQLITGAQDIEEPQAVADIKERFKLA